MSDPIHLIMDRVFLCLLLNSNGNKKKAITIRIIRTYDMLNVVFFDYR
jgi:hypothetical protein